MRKYLNKQACGKKRVKILGFQKRAEVSATPQLFWSEPVSVLPNSTPAAVPQPSGWRGGERETGRKRDRENKVKCQVPHLALGPFTARPQLIIPAPAPI